MTHSRKTGRIRRTVGNVLAVPLGEDWFGFAWVLNSPLVAFLDLRCRAGAFPPVEEIVRRPIAFRIWVMNPAVTSGAWPRVGHVPVPEDLLEPPWFFKQDSINGRIFKLRTGTEEFIATASDVEALECAAVWSATHVERRLREHFAGLPSTGVQVMKIKPPEFFAALRANQSPKNA